MLAARLGCLYLDTGALYRAIAWKVKASGVDPCDRAAVACLLPAIRLQMERRDDQMTVLVDGQELREELRTPEISGLASVISAIPAVREWLLPFQRRAAEGGTVVAEGRDIGTRVFPEADVKFYLDADPEIRANRRYRELAGSGIGQSLDHIREEVRTRDERDRARDIAPLVQARDAHLIDTSTLKEPDVLDRMMAVIAAKL